jgi:hypothetical protein
MKHRKPITLPTSLPPLAAMVLDGGLARLAEVVERVLDRNMPERQPEEQNVGAA